MPTKETAQAVIIFNQNNYSRPRRPVNRCGFSRHRTLRTPVATDKPNPVRKWSENGLRCESRIVTPITPNRTRTTTIYVYLRNIIWTYHTEWTRLKIKPRNGRTVLRGERAKCTYERRRCAYMYNNQSWDFNDLKNLKKCP